MQYKIQSEIQGVANGPERNMKKNERNYITINDHDSKQHNKQYNNTKAHKFIISIIRNRNFKIVCSSFGAVVEMNKRKLKII